MGRGKNKGEYLQNEKARKMAFIKKKKGLMKQAEELSTLCDIDVCMIIYDSPESVNSRAQPDIWSSKFISVGEIIEIYKEKLLGERCSNRRVQNSTLMYTNLIKKTHEEIAILRSEYVGKRYAINDNNFDGWSVEKLKLLAGKLDHMIDVGKMKNKMTEASTAFPGSNNYGNSNVGSTASTAFITPVCCVRPFGGASSSNVHYNQMNGQILFDPSKVMMQPIMMVPAMESELARFQIQGRNMNEVVGMPNQPMQVWGNFYVNGR